MKIIVRAIAFAISFAAALLGNTLITHRAKLGQIHRDSIATVQSSPGPAKCESTTDDDEVTVEGRYANFDYAYSVVVPKGMMAVLNATPPAPNHGFGIDLTNPTSIPWVRNRESPKALLWADASYDAAEIGSADNEIKSSVNFLREKHKEARLVRKIPTRLGSLKAIRFVIAYEELGEAMIDDEIVAFRSQLGDDSDIIYSISLTTPSSRYNADKRLVSEMQRSWMIDPLPNDYPVPPIYEENHQ